MANSLTELVNLSCEIKKALVENMGELDEATCRRLDELDLKLANKADGYKHIIDDFKSEATLWKKRAQDFLSVAKAFENYSDKMLERIEVAMLEMGVDEFLGNDYRWKLQKAKETVIIDNHELIPAKHIEIVQTKVIKKDSIRDSILLGEKVDGARLEPSTYVRSYPNKKK